MTNFSVRFDVVFDKRVAWRCLRCGGLAYNFSEFAINGRPISISPDTDVMCSECGNYGYNGNFMKISRPSSTEDWNPELLEEK